MVIMVDWFCLTWNPETILYKHFLDSFIESLVLNIFNSIKVKVVACMKSERKKRELQNCEY